MVAILGDTAPLYEIVKKLPTHFNLERRASKMVAGVDDPQQQQPMKTLVMCTES